MKDVRLLWLPEQDVGLVTFRECGVLLYEQRCLQEV